MKSLHHKNTRRWKRAITEFDVPHELAKMLLYLEGPHKMLLHYQLLDEQPCATVFVDKPLSSADLAALFVCIGRTRCAARVVHP